MPIEYDFYVYVFNYDMVERCPVKAEIEVYNFVSELDETDLQDMPFMEILKSMVVERLNKEVPFREREWDVHVSFERADKTLKPPSKIVEYELYHLYKKGSPPYVHVDKELGEINA